MMKFYSNYFSKLTGQNKWDAFLPFILLPALFFFLLWQFNSFKMMTDKLNRSGTVLWNLKEADSYILEMHHDLKGYHLTQRSVFDSYFSGLRKIEATFERLKLQGRSEIQGSLDSIESDFSKWNKLAQYSLRVQEPIPYENGRNLVVSMREKIAQTIKEEIELRRQVQREFRAEGVRFFFWSGLALLLLSALFIAHWIRGRKWSMKLQASEEAYRDMAASATLAEQRFRGLLESAHDLILIMDQQGRILYVNQQLAQSFGYLREELIGKEIEVLVPDKYRELHVIQRNNYIKHPVARPMGAGIELFGKKKDGCLIPIDVSLSPFKMEGILQVAAIIRDISDRKDFEKKQKWMVEFGQIINASLEPNCLMVSAGNFFLERFADWCVFMPRTGDYCIIKKKQGSEPIIWSKDTNELWEALLGLVNNKKPFLKQNISQDDLRKLPLRAEQMSFAFEMGIKSVIVFPLVGRDKLIGASVLINSSMNYSIDDVDFIQGMMDRAALALDNAHLYQISQHSIRMRDELLRIVSHDLKNPLSSIKLNGQVLEKQLADKLKEHDKIVIKKIKAIEKSSDHAINLIRELLDNAKIETGGLKLNKAPLRPDHLLSEVVEVFQSLAEEKKIKLIAKSNIKRNFTIRADHERVMQVISNLLGNSFKYTPEGGQVELDLKEKQEVIEISVRDNGPGISQTKQDHLFEKYWRDEETGLHNLGLGLAIAKGVVEAHGGQIWVESEEGAGTTITFSLPSKRNDGSDLMSLDPSSL